MVVRELRAWIDCPPTPTPRAQRLLSLDSHVNLNPAGTDAEYSLGRKLEGLASLFPDDSMLPQVGGLLPKGPLILGS